MKKILEEIKALADDLSKGDASKTPALAMLYGADPCGPLSKSWDRIARFWVRMLRFQPAILREPNSVFDTHSFLTHLPLGGRTGTYLNEIEVLAQKVFTEKQKCEGDLCKALMAVFTSTSLPPESLAAVDDSVFGWDDKDLRLYLVGNEPAESELKALIGKAAKMFDLCYLILRVNH